MEYGCGCNCCNLEVPARIEAEAERDALIEALDPFASLPVDDDERADYAFMDEGGRNALFYVSDVKRARAALSQTKGKQDG